MIDTSAAKNTGSLLQLWSVITIIVMGMILGLPASTTAMVTSGGSIRLVSNCTCIDYPLEFQCITVGRGATIWRGSAFNCPSSSDKIQLFHSRFTTGTATGSCNNGNIIARALDTTEGQYRSQLNIHNLTPAMIGTTVECAYDNGTHVHPINSITISITAAFPPPVNITLNIVSKGILLFSWNPVAPACTGIQYNINADKCGRCPMATNLTSVICTDVEIEDEELCRFGVSTVVCSGVTEMHIYNYLETMLRVPNIATSTIEVTPTYENPTNNLTKLTTGFNAVKNNLMQPTHNVNSSILSYTINYTDANTGESCGNGTIPATSCINGACSHEFQVISSKCPPKANFTIKMYGTNALGNGRNSNPIRRDFTNHFVKVVANPLRRMITCEFYHTVNSSSTKSCNATYFDEHCQNKLFTINASNTGNSVNVDLHYLSFEHKRYCYAIAANTGTMEVHINGFITYKTESDTNDNNIDDWIIAVSVFFPVIFVITVTVFVILTTIYVKIHPSGRHNIIMKQKKS